MCARYRHRYPCVLRNCRVRTAPAVPYGAAVNTANAKPPLPSFLAQPTGVYSRYTNQLSTPEAASYREENRDWTHKTYATSYHDAVQFSGGSHHHSHHSHHSRGSHHHHKASAAHFEASDFHNALYGSAGDIGSIKGLQLDGTQTSHGGDTRMEGSVCRYALPRHLCCLCLSLIHI